MVLSLDKEQKDRILNTLSSEQKSYLNDHVKRGKKTAFANEMAKDKGIVLPDSASSEEIESLLEEWVLEDCIDNGFVNPLTPCQCGRPLRYQYVVKHKTSNEYRTFGIKHFEEHSGLPSKIVKEILKGFNKIDYELDDLLQKISTGWSLENNVGPLPDGYVLSKEYEAAIGLGLPLLDRQINRLVRDIYQYIDEQELSRPVIEIEESSSVLKSVKNVVPEGENLFLDLWGNDEPIIQKGSIEDMAFELLKSGTSSVRIICELLIKKYNAPPERFVTGKPLFYPAVCLHFEALVKQGILRVEASKDMQDRQYFLI